MWGWRWDSCWDMQPRHLDPPGWKQHDTFWNRQPQHLGRHDWTGCVWPAVFHVAVTQVQVWLSSFSKSLLHPQRSGLHVGTACPWGIKSDERAGLLLIAFPWGWQITEREDAPHPLLCLWYGTHNRGCRRNLDLRKGLGYLIGGFSFLFINSGTPVTMGSWEECQIPRYSENCLGELAQMQIIWQGPQRCRFSRHLHFNK